MSTQKSDLEIKGLSDEALLDRMKGLHTLIENTAITALVLQSELIRRYKGMKDLARTAVHGKGCGCLECIK
jgi:hypothetical protein